MARGLQLISRGLAALQTACGETFRLADNTEFAAVRQERERVVEGLGTVVDVELQVLRSDLAALPTEGAVITQTQGALVFRTVKVRPGPVGYVIITVTSEAR